MMLDFSLTSQMIKDFRSLHLKKYRDRLGLFTAEGRKLIEDLLGSQMRPQWLLTTDEELFNLWGQRYPGWKNQILLASPQQMKSLSTLSTPTESLGVFPLLEQDTGEDWIQEGGWHLVLDGVQNPGNLGTILRSADWFGFNRVFCGLGTADVYSSKGVQATMGSLARVKIWYGDLSIPLKKAREADWTVVGAQLEGTNIYEWRENPQGSEPFPPSGLLVLGSEGQGIGDVCRAWVREWVTIPSFSRQDSFPESLNVGAAAAVILSEIRRKLISDSRKET